ncbi:MAG TPA: isopentenyl phosphate kinase, partial [Herpetosiphonaceae bacterium]
QLAAARRDRPGQPLLIGHGGGSFGHYWAERYATHRGIAGPESWQGVVRVADAMGRLHRAVLEALLEAELPAVGLQPMASARASGGVLAELAVAPIETLLANGLIPVVYGDVALDDRQGCAIISTEALFSFLAPRLLPARIILLGEAAVYDADPRSNPAARPLPRIDRANYAEVLAALGGSHGVDVTGGMRSKIEAMWRLAAATPGMEIVICGPGELAAALAGEQVARGTLVVS